MADLSDSSAEDTTGEQAGREEVLVKEGDHWVAQCLEYDIGAQSCDPHDLPQRLVATIELQRQETIARHGHPFAGIGRAPEHFFMAWDQRNTLFKPTEINAPGIVGLAA